MKNLIFSKNLVRISLIFFSLALLFAQQSAYNGSLVIIPSQIEAEDFDNGGEGIAFHDIDEINQGGAYRDTSVDIEASGDGDIMLAGLQLMNGLSIRLMF